MAAALAVLTAELTEAVTAALTAAVSESGSFTEDPVPLTATPVSIPPAPRLLPAGEKDGPRAIVETARVGTVADTSERVAAGDLAAGGPAAGYPAGASGSSFAVSATGLPTRTPRH